MVFQQIRATSSNTDNRSLSQQIFTIIFLAIVVGWIIIALWTRVIDNFTYGSLGLKEDSTWDSLLIALVVTIFFVTLVWLIDQYNFTGPNNLGEEVDEELAPVPSSLTSTLTGQSVNQPGFQQSTTLSSIFPGVVFR